VARSDRSVGLSVAWSVEPKSDRSVVWSIAWIVARIVLTVVWSVPWSDVARSDAWVVARSDCTVTRSDRGVAWIVALSGDRSFGWSVARNALSIVWNDSLAA